jgi:hypothetical protein
MTPLAWASSPLARLFLLAWAGLPLRMTFTHPSSPPHAAKTSSAQPRDQGDTMSPSILILE